ncbi:copper chaperone [Pichia kluyveri]|uniref:Superoxide dismutase 1 copper chaperone n=1 Tax=Pichia kluyveri TaxID=36015 RepID=A0AAV5R764_PICKL|nr:copper chaperone [Pichia kluyveri]
MTISEAFETVYNVPLLCNSCIESVTKEIKKNEGINEVKCDLQKQTVSVLGTTAPSKIIKSIQETGKDAIIRGTGSSNSAAVCILEDFNKSIKDFNSIRDVYGLCRIIKIKENESFIDLTLTGMKPSIPYFASFMKSGDLSNGPLNTGDYLYKLPKMISDLNGKCQQFISIPIKMDELIGRSLVVSIDENKIFMDSMAGVIARSAGAWENDKYVCSCTGKNIWQERIDAKERGIN